MCRLNNLLSGYYEQTLYTTSTCCVYISMTGLSKTAHEASRSMPRKMKLPPVKEIETEVSPTGNGAHVFVPKDWLGKKVRVTLIEEL